MHQTCFQCDIKQMLKISEFLTLDETIENQLIDKTNEYLLKCDMTKTNPEIMADIWEIVNTILGNNNPYQKIKSYYNQFMISLLKDLEQYINNDLNTALKVAIAANLIDFSAKDKISLDEIKYTLFTAKNLNLAIDDSKKLFRTLQNSTILLYLGDNCGEIVLDKLLLKMIKNEYPHLDIYYGVRGKPIVNDVTIDDATEVKMDEIAKIISNEDGSLGTVLIRTSQEFQTLFNQADVVICKGQGNYEGLFDCKKENLYFLFMTKCQLVANLSHTKISDIVCLKNK